MTTSEPMLQEGSPTEPSGQTRPSRWSIRRGVAIAIVVVLLAVGYVYIDNQAKKYYTISPGTAPVVSADPSCATTGSQALQLPGGKPCVRLIVPPGKAVTIDGSIMMVDVLVGQTTFGEYLAHELHILNLFEQGATLEPAPAVLGSTPAGQLGCQDTQDMTDATSSAAVVALRRLGYPVSENFLGAQVDLVVPGTPAAKAGIQCDDLVTAVDGHPVHTAADLSAAIHALRPGTTAKVAVSRLGSSGRLASVLLTAHLVATPSFNGQPAVPNQAFLGVDSESRITFTYPYSVKIDVGNIGGPSAGLALTLGLLDALSNGQLTGGHRVAATGTIDLNGQVGAIGDAAQKAVAVRRAGAQVFLVPPDNYQAAKSESGSMKVLAVSTLQQALDDLQALGGRIPSPVSLPNAGV